MSGSELPLAGYRVLELGGYVAAPYATLFLNMLGAEVVKVERPSAGDDFRRGEEDRSIFFRQYNAGKKSLAVDLKHPDGVRVVHDLIPRFDVLMENMRPGKLSALGLSPQVCRGLHPTLVYSSVTGFGPTGPLADQPSYDSIAQAFTGMYSILSDSGAPQISGTCLADLIGGLVHTTGVLASLVSTGRTGLGRRVETSLMEATTVLAIDALTQFYDDGHRDPSRQSRHPQAQNFALPTADGESITLHLSSSERFWSGLVAAIERPDLHHDPRWTAYPLRVQHYHELATLLADEFRRRPSKEWLRRLRDADVPHAPVLRVSGFTQHPQAVLLDLFEAEQDGLALLRAPWRFEGVRPRRQPQTPVVGEHTREIAGEVCAPDRLAELLDNGVLHAGVRR